MPGLQRFQLRQHVHHYFRRHAAGNGSVTGLPVSAAQMIGQDYTAHRQALGQGNLEGIPCGCTTHGAHERKPGPLVVPGR